ncbi:MAG: AI-2E family transporter [Lachnospiraceae bacterium]|jgi:sporulation integral membrane protein YtvI|nr:AI-2E family transporter [Lachnospiraceae bacterium]
MEWMKKNKILLEKIGIIAFVYLGMKYLVPLVIPFLIAAAIVCWLWPFLKWIRNHLRIQPPYVMAVLLIIIGGLLVLGIYAAGKELGALAAHVGAMLEGTGQIEKVLYDCCDSMSELFHMEASSLRVFVTDQLNVFRDHARQNILPGAFGGSWQFLKGAGSWVAAVVVTGISMLLLSSDFEEIKKMGKRCPFYNKAVNTIRGMMRAAGGYVKAQCMIMGIVMLLCVLGVWISGSAKAPVAVGIGIGFLDALPVFGTGTVFVPWILIQVLQKKYISAVVLAVTYGICMLTRELLEPRLIGNRLGLLPIVILMSVYVGVKLYGAGGILLGPLSVLLIRELWGQVNKE